jgi:hypothetical protein
MTFRAYCFPALLILSRILLGKRRAKLPHKTREGRQPEDWKSRDPRLKEIYAVTMDVAFLRDGMRRLIGKQSRFSVTDVMLFSHEKTA